LTSTFCLSSIAGFGFTFTSSLTGLISYIAGFGMSILGGFYSFGDSRVFWDTTNLSSLIVPKKEEIHFT
jgi:hypothetical protein